MNNPKTTIIGYLCIVGGVAAIGLHVYNGEWTQISNHLDAILAILAGSGLVAAQDGGH